MSMQNNNRTRLDWFNYTKQAKKITCEATATTEFEWDGKNEQNRHEQSKKQNEKSFDFCFLELVLYINSIYVLFYLYLAWHNAMWVDGWMKEKEETKKKNENLSLAIAKKAIEF